MFKGDVKFGMEALQQPVMQLLTPTENRTNGSVLGNWRMCRTSIPSGFLLRNDQSHENQLGRLRSYLAKVESIQGKNGSSGLVRAVAICRDKGLSEAEAMIDLLWWNQQSVVNPSWPEREVARAVTRTYARRRTCG